MLDRIRCVRWSADGTFFATCSDDKRAKVTHFQLREPFYTGTTADRGNL